jgi:hypothetical protein
MIRKVLAILVVLGVLLIPAAASQAGPLFPLALGMHYDYDGSDNAGHTWKCQVKVMASGISLNGQTYFHIRSVNPDPIDTNRHNPQDYLMRCTDTQAYLSKGGSEALQYQTGPTSTPSWTTLDGQTALITSATSNITVPAGTFNPSFENRFTVDPNPPWYAYLYPNLGLVKQVDHWVAAGRDPAILALRATGTAPVTLFPMKTGMRLVYNASDALGNTWKMTKHVREQVSIQGQAFFRVQTTNFDPIEGESGGNQYLRSTAQQVLGSWDGISANIWYQANSPVTTTWQYPGEGGFGIAHGTITGVAPLQVLGGSYLAYANQIVNYNPSPGPSEWFYLVPGLGVAYEDSYRLDGKGTRLYFTLASITQEGPGAAVNLLLMD